MHFHSTWSAWALHLLAAILLLVALIILARKTGWLRNVVVLALLFFMGSEIIVVFNLATARAYSSIICPIGNSLYLWAIPLFGYVYLREQSLEKKRAEQSLKVYRDHLEELVDARTAELAQANARLERTATLEERQRIAANLHDGLAQTLSYVSIISSQTENLLLKGDVVEAKIEFPRISLAVERAIAEVRQCIRSLREDPPPAQSLQEALQGVIGDLMTPVGPDIWLDSHISQPVFLDVIQMEQVRRVAREAVANALRHAGASIITVTVQHEPDCFSVTISDNGCGFDPMLPPGADGNHFGLSIMEARANRLGGTLRMDSENGRGTCVILTWPDTLAGAPQPLSAGAERNHMEGMASSNQ